MVDFYWHDTMYVLSWPVIIIAGILTIGVLVAVILLVWLLARALYRRR